MDLILSSNFPLNNNEEVMEYLKDILNVQTPKTAFITALKQVEEFETYKHNMMAYGLQHIEYFEIAKDIFASLQQFDILYLHGGDPFIILQQYRKSGFNDCLLDYRNTHKIMLSTSGSSMVLSSNISLLYWFYPKSKKYKSNEDMEGLNIFPYVVLPHYDRYKKKGGIEILKEYSRINKRRVYALYDGSAIVYREKGIKTIGRVVIYENGKELINA